MSLSLTKDPAKRLGGWALVRLPAKTAAESTVTVRRSDTAEWLGAADWQGGRYAFGPYPIENDPKGAFVRIGPEIVNRMEPYLPFTMALPELGHEAELDWPEDILPAPEGAVVGGVGRPPDHGNLGGRIERTGVGVTPEVPLAATPGTAPPEPPLTEEPMRSPEPQPSAGLRSPENLPTGQMSEPEPETEWKATPSSKAMGLKVLLFVLPVVLIAAAVGWWFMLGPGAVDEQPVAAKGGSVEEGPVMAPPAPPVSEEEGESPAVTCARDNVAGLLRADEPDVEAMRGLAAVCHAAADIDLEVRLWEKLAALSDGQALLRFGEWYDPRENAESRPFGAADAANAANYYKRAIEVGADGAEEALNGLCTHLRGQNDRGSQMVVTIHCE